MKDQKDLIQWIKEHKKELIIAGVSIGTLILIILGIKNRNTFKAVWKSLEKIAKQQSVKIPEATPPEITEGHAYETIQEALIPKISEAKTVPFEVSQHIRNLPKGQHASKEKIAEALKNNIPLREGQTWVEGYRKGGIAA